MTEELGGNVSEVEESPCRFGHVQHCRLIGDKV